MMATTGSLISQSPTVDDATYLSGGRSWTIDADPEHQREPGPQHQAEPEAFEPPVDPEHPTASQAIDA